jgi:hypothetical protein
MANGQPKANSGRPPNDGEAALSWIQLRTTTRRKSAYVRAANKRKLSEWVFEHLDKAAGYTPSTQDQ